MCLRTWIKARFLFSQNIGGEFPVSHLNFPEGVLFSKFIVIFI